MRAGCDEEIAEKIIALRPFRNVDDVYRKLDSTPKLSRRLYDNCESLMAVRVMIPCLLLHLA